MIPKDNAWSIVINGHWNRMIFTPNWVGKKMFNAENVERLVSMVPTAPVVYQNDDVRIAICEERLVVSLRKLNTGCMKRAEDIAVNVLKLLHHTPVSAIGVNFGFTEDAPSDALLELFGYSDNAGIGTQGWDISQSNLIRELQDKENKNLNFKVSFDIIAVHFDANFHHSVGSAQEAADIICGKTKEMYERFCRLLGEVYGVKLSEEKKNG